MISRDRNYITIPASRFFSQFIVSPFRGFLILVLREMGFSAYLIGLTVAIADASALFGSLLGAYVSDFIGRKNSSALGRSIFALGLFLMYVFFEHKQLVIVSLALANMGLLWGRSASYVLVGETSSKRVSFTSYSFAINDFGGFIGLLLFVRFLEHREAIEVFPKFLPLWSLLAFLSATLILLSRETLSGKTEPLRLDGRRLRYLFYIAIFFIGVAIVRTFSPLYAKEFIGITDRTRGEISMLSIALEGVFFLIVSRLSPSSSQSLIASIAAYSLAASLLVLYPYEITAIIGFGVLMPIFNALFLPSLLDFDLSVAPKNSRGRFVSVVFLFRRFGLMSGRMVGARLYVADPRFVMVAPMIIYRPVALLVLKTLKKRVF